MFSQNRKILIAYASQHGSTVGIANAIRKWAKDVDFKLSAVVQ